MAFFFAYGTELIRADLLTRALTSKATPRVVESVTAGAAPETAAAATGKDTAPPASTEASYDEYAMRRPVATGFVQDVISCSDSATAAWTGRLPTCSRNTTA